MGHGKVTSAGIAHFTVCLISALLTLLAVAPDSDAADSSPPTRTVAYGQAWRVVSTTLNGLPVLIVQDEQSSSFDFGLREEAGYYSDPESYDGLAHIAEHLIAWGQLPTFGESLGHWIRRDQARNLGFHTEGSHTDFYLSSAAADAGELLERFSHAIVRSEYSAEDVSEQLHVIEGDRDAYETSADGVLLKTLGSLANQEHPYHRVFSSGGEAGLGTSASPELVARINEFLKAHYTGNQSALVVMSPLPPDKVLELLRNHLGMMLDAPAAGSIPAAYRSIAAFTPATRSVLHEASYPTPEDQLVIEFALPNTLRRRDSLALSLMAFALADGTPNTLDARLESRGDALKTTVDTGANELDGADNVVFRITLTPQGAAHVDRVYAAARAQIDALLSTDRQALAARFVSSTERRALFGPQAARKPMIFDALEAVAAGSGARAFDYEVDVSDRDWAEFQNLRAAIHAMVPVHIHFKGTGNGTASSQPVRHAANSFITTSAPAAPEALRAAARCILDHQQDTSPCLQPYWGIEARRSALPLLDGLQHSLARALLRQSKKFIEDRFTGFENSLQIAAETSPAIAVYGHGADRGLILKTAWAEFLRERTPGELADLKAQLVSSPHDAYDQAETVARTLLGFDDENAAGNIRSEAEFKLAVAALQARYRSAPTEDYGIDPGPLPETGESTTTRLPPATRSIRYAAASTFKTSSLFDMQCSRASPELQTMLRVAVGPAHRQVLSTARASADASAFGAYMLQEWGDQLCHGISLDSSALSADEIHASKDALAQAVENLFCEITPAKWAEMKQATLASEASRWSRDEAFALQDMRNWMRSREAMLTAREVHRRVEALRAEDVCSWIRTGRSPLDRSASRIDVLIERAH